MMDTFATEVARDIQKAPAFWEDLSLLRAFGIRSKLPQLSDELAFPDEGVLARLMSSASVFAQADDEVSKDLAQQIAVFSTLTSKDAALNEAAVQVMSALGNFPGLDKLVNRDVDLRLPTLLRRGLLAELNTVNIDGHERPLTEFQLAVWRGLNGTKSVAVSAPTSAGKSFVILEHLCTTALHTPGFVAIYLAPTRALLAEIQAKLEARLGVVDEQLRITTIPTPDPQARPKQIFVLTQERAQLLLSAGFLKGKVKLIVVDEAQSIGDSSRGMILQDSLEKLRSDNPDARFLFLAPGANGFEVMQETVGLDTLVIQQTSLSPVVQNRINVKFVPRDEHRLSLALISDRGPEPIGTLQSARGFALNTAGRLAAVACELGSTGRSLVYASGAKKAEDLAKLIALNSTGSLTKAREELAHFVETHIHEKYSLASYIRAGVAFHYGNMPSLLREGIEGAFRKGELDFLCCTTTLFQGINLPARNVFIDSPTRGNKGTLLDEAALWNFAGRAGRLGEEVVGNVFLVDYDKWSTQPLTKRRQFELRVAFNDTLSNELEQVIEVLERTSAAPDTQVKPSPAARMAAGLAMFRASQGTLSSLLDRSGNKVSLADKGRLQVAAKGALEALGLPTEILATNWVVDPLALSRLLVNLRHSVASGQSEQLVPVNPSGDAYDVYKSIFRRMYKTLGGFDLEGSAGAKLNPYVAFMTMAALKWMRGLPLAAMVKDRVAYETRTDNSGKAKQEGAVVDKAVRETFVLVETKLRFELVQWAKAYVDLCRFVLTEGAREDLASQVYDFSLALELGISNTTGRSLVELGLSRITASSVAALIADSDFTTVRVKSWLRDKSGALLQLSPIILGELRGKKLILG